MQTAGAPPARAQNLRHWFANWWPALPLLTVAACLLVAPVIALILQSFHAEEGGLTLAHWHEVLSSHTDQRAILTSLALGGVCATVALFIGAPLAWFISRMTVAPRAFWLAIFNVAANFGGIGLAFAYVATLGTLGMVTVGLKNIGAAFAAPTPGSFWGLVLAYEYSNIPLFVLLTMPAMSILRHEWWEAAQTAAATRVQFWRLIGLPILTPFLAAGWLLIFTWSIGLYGLPFALGGGSAAVHTRLITLTIGEVLQASFSGTERAAVMGVILLLIAATALWGYRWLLKKAMQWF